MHDVEAAKVHTVFSAECNPTFDWHSIALFHSHKTSGQPGGITRLLACNKDELATYHGLSIGQPQARVRARARVRVRVRFRVILCFLVRGTQASVLASLLTLALTLAAGGPSCTLFHTLFHARALALTPAVTVTVAVNVIATATVTVTVTRTRTRTRTLITRRPSCTATTGATSA